MVDKAVVEVEEEVAAAQGPTLEASNTSEREGVAETRMSARAPKVVKVEDVDES